MSYCPKCGARVREGMNFCPKCGTSLKVEQLPAEAVSPAPSRAEKAEKREKEEKEEKREKGEKEEKYERREFGYIGPLVGGLFLMFIGFILYFTVTASIRFEAVLALSFVIIGIIIIVGGVYAATMAARRHPRP